jgi:hypothetical protein
VIPPTTIVVTSTDPACRVAIRMSLNGTAAGRRIISSLQGSRDERRPFLYLAYEVVAGDDDSPTVTVSGVSAAEVCPGASTGSDGPTTELVLCDMPLQNAAPVVAPPHDLRRAPRGKASSDQDRSALRVARAGPWASVEHAAAFLDVPPVTLRRMLERHARRGEDGRIMATVDGITARKLGRAWRVLLDEDWRNPSGATQRARPSVRVPSRSA